MMSAVQEHGGDAIFLGIGSPTYGGHHSPSFDADEDMMAWGVDLLSAMCAALAHGRDEDSEEKDTGPTG